MAILALAAALRLVGSRYGLPLSVLNPDETSIVPRAWRMGHGHLDPGWYDYPSLLMAVLAPVQAVFGAPAFGAARLVAVAVGLGGVGATWWLGRRAYGTGAAIVGAATVAVATTHVAYSRMAVTDVLLTLAITCVLALAVEGRIEWAGLAVGLAASAKYPGAIAVVPVVVAGWGRWRALGRAAALAVAGFALTSPFVLIHAGAAWDDVSRVQRLARAGWLGFENDPITPVAYLDRLWEAIGPLLLVAAVGRRRRALAPHPHRPRAALVRGRLLADADAAAGALRPLRPAARAGARRARRERPGRRSSCPSSRCSCRSPGAPMPPASSLAPTPACAPTPGWPRMSPAAIGSPPTRRRCPCPAETSSGSSSPARGAPSDPERDLARLRRQGVEWVIVSGAVTDRVLAAPDSYPREASFYAQLGHTLEPAFGVFPDEPGLAGPWVRVYRL